MAGICNCGLLTQTRSGTREVHGQEICNKCGLPITVDLSGVPRPKIGDNVVLSTTEGVPGYAVVEYKGIATGFGHLDASDTTVTDRKRNEADMRRKVLLDGLRTLKASADELGANAVVGVQMQVVAGNVGGATIGTAAGRGDAISLLLIGTAAVIAPISEDRRSE